jgi:Domain of unknown function (DUF4129)
MFPVHLLSAVLLLTTPDTRADDEVQEALRQAYAQPGLQRDYPAGLDLREDASAEAAMDPLVALLRWLGLGGVVSQLLRLLGVGAAILVVLLGSAWLARRLGERGDLASAAESPGGDTLDAGPLLDAEALAREGRFGEAIHLLLLRTFEVLARRMGSRLVPGMTAREALARLALPPPARPALADLVEAVETTTFAGRTASEGDYLRCTERFTLLQSALSGARG